MICDFLKSFSREEKQRAKPTSHARALGSKVLRDPSSVGHSPATFSHKGRREIEP